MSSVFLLYGATGFVGEAIARLAVEEGLEPILAGRDAVRVEQLAAELGVEYRVFDLQDPHKIEQGLKDTAVVLHCAGPFIHTFEPMVEACLQTGTHYLDLTGEIPVYESIAARDAQAEVRGIMLLPGAGFDVVPTDCLAVHLKQRLPSATRLALAFKAEGPARMPPGTQRTGFEVVIPYGVRVRRNGRLEHPKQPVKTRLIDFGRGPVQATLYPWGDVFTAYYSTSIPNIEDYSVVSEATRKQLATLAYLRPVLKLSIVRNLLKRAVRPGPTAERRARTVTHVWGEVEDDQGRKVVSRLHGPEAGVVWTSRAALAAVRKVLTGDAPPGFQTPAKAYGADFVLECEGVTREDVD
ncbi:MAG: saccharopine dehydrogenase NADP-binding domain-containing protein [Anaerolineales bacterium]